MSIEATEFRRVLGQFASGVTVITTRYRNQLHGTTVSSFCSLSLNPPLVLICLDLKATIHGLIAASEVFGVNILAEQSEEISRRFAHHALDEFSDVIYSLGQLGVPLLHESLATLECRVVERYPGGDHAIVIGEVVSTRMFTHSQPLLFFRSKYNRLQSNMTTLTKSVAHPGASVNSLTATAVSAQGTALD